MTVNEILEMSYPRRVVETIINGLQDPLNQHLIKLVGFEFTPELREHFRQECEAWLDRIQRLRLKPHNRAWEPSVGGGRLNGIVRPLEISRGSRT